MRKRIEQYSQNERQSIVKVAEVVERVWKNGCHKLIVDGESDPSVPFCWQEKYDWVISIRDLAEDGSGKIPTFPRKRVYGCNVCLYRNVADQIK